MYEIRDGLYYTDEHEWISVDGRNVRFGMSDYAQHELGDVVYIELPAPGTHIVFGEEIGAMESVKSVEPIYAPVTGTIIEINPILADDPESINRSPYDEGWMAVIEMDNTDGIKGLADSDSYRKKME